MQIPLAELIRDLRSEKAKEGRGLVYASEHITPNKKEQQAMKYFSMVATSPKQWRFALKFVHYFGNVGKVFAPLIPGLKQWSKYRDLPTINGNLDSKVKQLQGVIYE